MNAIETGGLVTGEQSDCLRFCRTHGLHYVYILRRPDGRACEVGKGAGDRVAHHENEARHPIDRRSNPHKLNVIRSIWRSGHSVGYEIDLITADPVEALAREAALIGAFGRLHENGPLTNRAPGGGEVGKASPFSKEKHTATLAGVPEDNPDRAVLNRFVLSIAQMRSVVLKPLGQFTPRPTQPFPKTTRKLSLRQATAIVASASANGVLLDGETDVPRRVVVEGVDGFVENGVSCDLLTSGSVEVLASKHAADEVFRLNAEQIGPIVDLVGRKRCIDLGVIPDRQAHDQGYRDASSGAT